MLKYKEMKEELCETNLPIHLSASLRFKSKGRQPKAPIVVGQRD
jgi:hypothetical protein